ncbi:hypothetical protein BJY01DRAFT_225455 [Aspergillus pseudoustus]|uniref:Ankyrin repeat-containing domain protein n=1 Tax=Aspergillus pseudoustus TaxID=1810923 RepID=A0ABR4IZB6_9EURO
MSPKANPTSAEELLDFLLLQQGFDVESLNEKGETPLLAVVQHQHSERATRLLIERGANPCFHQSASGGLCPLVASVRKRTCDTCREFSTWLPRDWFRGNCTNPYTFQILLQGMEERGIPWDVVEPQLRDAMVTAERDGADGDVIKALRKWYWRKRYPVPA